MRPSCLRLPVLSQRHARPLGPGLAVGQPCPDARLRPIQAPWGAQFRRNPAGLLLGLLLLMASGGGFAAARAQAHTVTVVAGDTLEQLALQQGVGPWTP